MPFVRSKRPAKARFLAWQRSESDDAPVHTFFFCFPCPSPATYSAATATTPRAYCLRRAGGIYEHNYMQSRGRRRKGKANHQTSKTLHLITPEKKKELCVPALKLGTPHPPGMQNRTSRSPSCNRVVIVPACHSRRCPWGPLDAKFNLQDHHQFIVFFSNVIAHRKNGIFIWNLIGGLLFLCLVDR